MPPIRTSRSRAKEQLPAFVPHDLHLRLTAEQASGPHPELLLPIAARWPLTQVEAAERLAKEKIKKGGNTQLRETNAILHFFSRRKPQLEKLFPREPTETAQQHFHRNNARAKQEWSDLVLEEKNYWFDLAREVTRGVENHYRMRWKDTARGKLSLGTKDPKPKNRTVVEPETEGDVEYQNAPLTTPLSIDAPWEDLDPALVNDWLRHSVSMLDGPSQIQEPLQPFPMSRETSKSDSAPTTPDATSLLLDMEWAMPQGKGSINDMEDSSSEVSGFLRRPEEKGEDIDLKWDDYIQF